MNKSNKTLLLSGTSRGIGNKTALEFMEQGIGVVGLSRNKPSNLDAHPLYTHIYTDLANMDSQALSTSLKNVSTQIDYVIHNAGYLVNKPFVELTSEEIILSYQVNVLSSFELNKILLSEPTRLSPNARFVNIGTIGAIQGSVKFGGLAAYSTSKMAAIGLQELLAEEYKEHNYTFNTIALGSVQTDMLEAAFPGYQAQTQPCDIAQYLYTFCTQQAHLFNGKTIPLANSTP